MTRRVDKFSKFFKDIECFYLHLCHLLSKNKPRTFACPMFYINIFVNLSRLQEVCCIMYPQCSTSRVFLNFLAGSSQSLSGPRIKFVTNMQHKTDSSVTRHWVQDKKIWRLSNSEKYAIRVSSYTIIL